jgi:hypothetical protein
MKRVLFIIVLTLFFSCENDEDIIFEDKVLQENEKFGLQKQIGIENLIDFRGLKVNHRFSTNLINSTKSLSKIDIDPIDTIVKSNLDRYYMYPDRLIHVLELIIPDFPYNLDDPMTENNFNMIRSDFPLLSDQQIVSQMETIEEYYTINLDSEYRIKYDELYPIKTKPFPIGLLETQRSSSNYDWPKTKCALQASGYYEMSNLNGIVRTLKALYALNKGTPYALDYSTQHYPELNTDDLRNDTKRDTYRHMMWNAMLANYYFTLSSKSRRLNFANDFTTAWEDCGTLNNDAQKAMDLHNNQIGRDIWSANTRYVKVFGFTIGLNRPTHSLMKTRIGAKADWSDFVDVNTIGIPEACSQINSTNPNIAVHIKRPNIIVTDPIITYRPSTPEFSIIVQTRGSNNQPLSFVIESDNNVGISIGDKLQISYLYECYAQDQGNCGGPCGVDVVAEISFLGEGTVTQSLGTNKFILIPDSVGWGIYGDFNYCDYTEEDYLAIYVR